MSDSSDSDSDPGEDDLTNEENRKILSMILK